MGKYIHKKRSKKFYEDNMYKFEVIMKVHGKKPHVELYSINKDDLILAERLGYLTGNEEYENYFDWKPVTNIKNLEGGVKKVNQFTFDDKYVYAHTEERIYSLPKYLYKKLPNKEYILFARREG
jgi:hypothetical protein